MKQILLWFFSHQVWTGVAGLCAVIGLVVMISERNENHDYSEDDRVEEAIPQAFSKAENGYKNQTDNIVNNNLISKDNKVFSVFEEQVFELCGYQEFTAILTKTSEGKSTIKIRSMDRSIPGRSFRGYEQIVPTGKMIEISPNCSVVFQYEKLASTERIVVSYQWR